MHQSHAMVPDENYITLVAAVLRWYGMSSYFPEAAHSNIGGYAQKYSNIETYIYIKIKIKSMKLDHRWCELNHYQIIDVLLLNP